MINFDFYAETAENIAHLGRKSFEFLGDFVKELYDAGLLKIAEFKTVDTGEIKDKCYKAECSLWNAPVDPDELFGKSEERVILLTDTIRIFLTAFLSAKIKSETTSFAASLKDSTIEQVASRAQWLGKLGSLLEAVQDRKYLFFVIE
jgi:hypothetical protein